MDVKELRAQDESQLNDQLITLLKEHFELRMQQSTSQLSDLSKLSKTKKAKFPRSMQCLVKTQLFRDEYGHFFFNSSA